jgi:hypothetical protein
MKGKTLVWLLCLAVLLCSFYGLVTTVTAIEVPTFSYDSVNSSTAVIPTAGRIQPTGDEGGTAKPG